MRVLSTITNNWVGIGGALAVGLVVRSIKRPRLAIAAGLAVLMLVGVIGYITA